MGSIGGGGCYVNFIENFGMKINGFGVGVFFGVECIYDVMEEFSFFLEDKVNIL